MRNNLQPMLLALMTLWTSGTALAAPQASPLKVSCEALSGMTLPAPNMALPSGPVRIESAALQPARAPSLAERGPTPG